MTPGSERISRNSQIPYRNFLEVELPDRSFGFSKKFFPAVT